MIGQARQQWQHRAILAPFTSPMHFLPGLGLQEYLQKPLLLTGYSVLDSTDDLMIKVTSYQAMAPSWRRVLFMILTRLPSNENYWEFLWGRSKSENFLWICCLHLAGMYCLPICVHVTTHFIFYEQSFYSFHAILIYLVSNLVNADYKQQISRCQRYAIILCIKTFCDV